ncbi:hypothetical protein [Mangrovibacter sp. MFB070]|nr:hypothetical protein [Mangrovibacter sp. MFB070]
MMIGVENYVELANQDYIITFYFDVFRTGMGAIIIRGATTEPA